MRGAKPYNLVNSMWKNRAWGHTERDLAVAQRIDDLPGGAGPYVGTIDTSLVQFSDEGIGGPDTLERPGKHPVGLAHLAHEGIARFQRLSRLPLQPAPVVAQRGFLLTDPQLHPYPAGMAGRRGPGCFLFRLAPGSGWLDLADVHRTRGRRRGTGIRLAQIVEDGGEIFVLGGRNISRRGCCGGNG